MHDFLVSAVAFIVLVGVMVVVHEFGHFIVAKLCGVRVEAFSFGFGPRLFGFKYGDTDYKVCLLPLGGFVKMTGESREQILKLPANRPRISTSGGRIPARSIIASALAAHADRRGRPGFNFLLAFVADGLLLQLGSTKFLTSSTATIEWVTPGSAAEQAGLQARRRDRAASTMSTIPTMETFADLRR